MINNCDDVPAGGIPWTLVVQRAREESLSYAFSLDWREGAGPRSLLRLGSAFSHEAKSGGQRKVGVKHPPRRAAVAFVVCECFLRLGECKSTGKKIPDLIFIGREEYLWKTKRNRRGFPTPCST